MEATLHKKSSSDRVEVVGGGEGGIGLGIEEVGELLPGGGEAEIGPAISVWFQVESFGVSGLFNPNFEIMVDDLPGFIGDGDNNKL